ncbi:glycosyltransferase family 4 protein [Thermosphaera sp.]
MRVALVSSGLVPVPPIKGGAVEEYVYQLSRHLRKLGVKAAIIDANYNSDEVIYENINGAEIVKVPTPKPITSFKKGIIGEFLFGRAVAKYVNKEGYDIIHANTAWVGFALAVHRHIRRTSQGFVYTCHNPLWPEDTVHAGEKIVRLVEGYAMRSSDLVIALNKTIYSALVSKAKLCRDKIVIIPNGVDTEFFRPSLKDENILNTFGLEEQEYILFVGRVSPEKGVHILLKAFRSIVKDTPQQMKLVTVGPLSSSFTSTQISSYARTLIEFAKRKLPGKVIFTGSAERNILRVLYSSAYCFVLRSLAEAFGMILLEAMASGVPPIGSTAGGIPDIIVDGVNGLLFRKGDWMDLVEKTLILIQDKSFRDGLAITARKYVEENYSWKSIALRVKNGVDGLVFEPGDVNALTRILEELVINENLRHALSRNAKLFASKFTAEKMAWKTLRVYEKLVKGQV